MNHELPTRLSQPAIRALLLENITSLEDVSRYTQKQLLKLHGFGPKGIRILLEEMSNYDDRFAESIFVKGS